MSKDIQIKEFTTSLRRIFYLSKILHYCVDDLKRMDITKQIPNIRSIMDIYGKGINARVRDLMHQTDYETAKKIKCDLDSDQLHEISLFLDTISDIKNLEEIRNVIEYHKKEQAA